MSDPRRTLRLVFRSPEAFQREFDSNLANGGAFVRTEEPLALRDLVTVRLELSYASRTLDLEGEIVHIVPSEMAGAGAAPGVAVQFTLGLDALRARFDELAVASAGPQVEGGGGQRMARRTPVRVPVWIDTPRGLVQGQTRNLSLTGILVGVEGGDVATGEAVDVLIEHPTRGEERTIPGEVVRRIESEGRVTGIAIHFTCGEDERGDVARFIESLQGAEHTRRLGGISGPIAELGPQSLLQMFGASAPAGTLVLRRDQEEGVICFEGGLLQLARVGGVTGMKALIRLLSWRDGVFEFHARNEGGESRDPPLPLEAALLDAVRQLDEVSQVDRRRFPLHAHVSLAPGGDVGAFGDPSKVESAVLDLARVGFTVQRMLEVIPEPDPEIFRALQVLVEAELIALEC